MVVLNVAAYGFTLVAARVLAPHEFGAVTALLAILLIGNVAALGLQATAARRIAVARDPHDVVVGATRDVGIGTALAVGAVVALSSVLLAPALRLDSPWPVVLCGVALVPMTLTGAQLGIAQGTEQWRRLALIYATLGLGRLLGGTIALLVRDDATSAMVGVAIGAWAPVVAGRGLLRGKQSDWAGRGSLARETLYGSHALAATLVLSNADAIVARSVLDTHDSGLYAAGLILTKAALFLPQFVSVLLYPALARDDTSRSRRRAVQIVLVIGAAAVGATAALPSLALVLAGGNQYAEVAPRLWLFALAGSCLAVVNLLVLDALARHAHRVVVLVWVAVAALLAYATTTSPDLTALVTAVAVVAAALGVAVWLLPGDDRRGAR